ncbi:MAG: alpha/beta fold hydrolase [Gemmatimonadales bacterium]
MATPTLSHHTLPGALGDILVDVRSASRSARQPAVLLHHGFKGFKDYAFFPPFADRLARAGFAAVTLSVSGSGVDESGEFTRLDRFAHNTYSMELDDLGVVVRALVAGTLGVAPPTSLGVVGHSRGGGMVLCLARETPAIAAVATWAAIGTARRHSDAELAAWQQAGTIQILHQRLRIQMPLSFDVAADCLLHEHDRLDIPAAARTLGRPWLQVHGRADQAVPFAEAEALDAVAGAGHETLFLDGADHTFGTKHPWAGSSAESDRVFDATVKFFSRTLD